MMTQKRVEVISLYNQQFVNEFGRNPFPDEFSEFLDSKGIESEGFPWFIEKLLPPVFASDKV